MISFNEELTFIMPPGINGNDIEATVLIFGEQFISFKNQNFFFLLKN